METLKIPEYTVFDLLESLANKGYGGVMSREIRTVAILKAQLSIFSGIISKGFSKPKQRLIKEIFQLCDRRWDLQSRFP